MAYNGRTWADGEVVYGADMNNLEQGLEDAAADADAALADIGTTSTGHYITAGSSVAANLGALDAALYAVEQALPPSSEGVEF